VIQPSPHVAIPIQAVHPITNIVLADNRTSGDDIIPAMLSASPYVLSAGSAASTAPVKDLSFSQFPGGFPCDELSNNDDDITDGR
jgi:hypothetical protein